MKKFSGISDGGLARLGKVVAQTDPGEDDWVQYVHHPVLQEFKDDLRKLIIKAADKMIAQETSTYDEGFIKGTALVWLYKDIEEYLNSYSVSTSVFQDVD